MSDAYIYDAVRTPRGKNRGGALHGTKPIDLVTGLIDAVLERNPEADPKEIDDIVLGVVTPVDEQGAVIARTAAIAAGLPDTVAGVQLNRFCASGLEAVNTAAQKTSAGWDQLVLAGGVESMSRVPMGAGGGAWAEAPQTAYHSYFAPQGIGADLIATTEGFSREDCDEYAVESQKRAENAWQNGYFDKSIVTVLAEDEHRRPGTTVDDLAKLKPSFTKLGEEVGFDAVALQKYAHIEKIDHVHHGGNSSGIVDGAALTLVGNKAIGEKLGMKPRARIVATAVTGSDPTIMLTGPTPATEKVLKTAGLKVEDIDLFELNEAFAAVVLKWMKDLNIPHDKVNVNGGAIAMGHPLGATGAMILGTLLDELERRDLKRGLATLCIGGGMGIATIIERV